MRACRLISSCACASYSRGPLVSGQTRISSSLRSTMLWFMTLFLQPPSITAPSVVLGFALAVAPVGCALHDGGQRLGALGEGHRTQQRRLLQIGRAPCRERGGQYVEIWWV